MRPISETLREMLGGPVLLRSSARGPLAFVAWDDARGVVVCSALTACGDLWELALSDRVLEAAKRDAGSTTDLAVCKDMVASLRLGGAASPRTQGAGTQDLLGAARVREEDDARKGRVVALVLVFDFEDPSTSFESAPLFFECVTRGVPDAVQGLLLRLWHSFVDKGTAGEVQNAGVAVQKLTDASSVAPGTKGVLAAPPSSGVPASTSLPSSHLTFSAGVAAHKTSKKKRPRAGHLDNSRKAAKRKAGAYVKLGGRKKATTLRLTSG